MAIYDLSPELLVTVVELCEDKDTYAFALCCRNAYNALSNILAKHQKLWQQWNTIDSNDNRKPFHEQILEFTRNPKLVSYVEVLSFDCELERRTYTNFETTEMMSRLLNLGKSDWNLFEDIFGDFDDLTNGAPRGHFHPNDHSCQLQWLSAYLVVVAPNLRRLECFGSRMAGDELLLLLANAARISPSMSALPLQQLRVVEVKLERNADEGGLPFDWLLASMGLPSVRTFAASRMSSDSVYLEQKEGLKSNLETLILENCTFETDVFARVLGSIQNLRIFSYSNGQDSNVGYGSFSPKRVTGILMFNAGHSLEHLTVCGRDHDVSIQRQKVEDRHSLTCHQEANVVHNGYEWPYVSLADFKKLKTLRCSTSLLTSDPEFIHSTTYETVSIATECRAGNGQRYEDDDFLQPTPRALRRLAFAARLPQSLKALHLEEYPCHTPLAYYALSEFVQKVDGLLPSLKQLYLDDWGFEYLQNKGLLGLVAQKGLKYKALHNPFQLYTRTRCDYNGSSAYQDDFEGEEEE
jgi:hypothetical protein